jgi:broad specificity phosphatase PhoE
MTRLDPAILSVLNDPATVLLMRHGDAAPYPGPDTETRAIRFDSRDTRILTAAGELQAERAAEWVLRTLAGPAPLVVSSALVRARQTARILAEGVGAPSPAFDARLNERGHGVAPAGADELALAIDALEEHHARARSEGRRLIAVTHADILMELAAELRPWSEEITDEERALTEALAAMGLGSHDGMQQCVGHANCHITAIRGNIVRIWNLPTQG